MRLLLYGYRSSTCITKIIFTSLKAGYYFCIKITDVGVSFWHVCVLSCVGLFAAPWTIAHQIPLSMEFSRQEGYWSGLPFPPPGDGSSQPRDRTCISYVSCIGRRVLHHCITWEFLFLGILWPSLVAWMVKNLLAIQETRVWSLSQKDPLEKGMATHSSILAWRIPWTEEPGELQSTGWQRVRHDWQTNTFFFLDSVKIWVACLHHQNMVTKHLDVLGSINSLL